MSCSCLNMHEMYSDCFNNHEPSALSIQQNNCFERFWYKNISSPKNNSIQSSFFIKLQTKIYCNDFKSTTIKHHEFLISTNPKHMQMQIKIIAWQYHIVVCHTIQLIWISFICLYKSILSRLVICSYEVISNVQLHRIVSKFVRTKHIDLSTKRLENIRKHKTVVNISSIMMRRYLSWLSYGSYVDENYQTLIFTYITKLRYTKHIFKNEMSRK